MCGRFTLTSDLRALELRFNFGGDDLDYGPRYNIAPTQEVLTVTHNSDNAGQYMRWGLVPFWAKDLKQRPQPINAKAETVADSRTFKSLLAKSRCLVPAATAIDRVGGWGYGSAYRRVPFIRVPAV